MTQMVFSFFLAFVKTNSIVMTFLLNFLIVIDIFAQKVNKIVFVKKIYILVVKFDQVSGVHSNCLSAVCIYHTFSNR